MCSVTVICYCTEKGSTEQVVSAATRLRDYEKQSYQHSRLKKPSFPSWCICRFEACSSIFCSLYFLLHLIHKQDSDTSDITQNNGKNICHKGWMHVTANFQKQEGKKRKINSYNGPKSLKTYWTACIFQNRIPKGMIWNKSKK